MGRLVRVLCGNLEDGAMLCLCMGHADSPLPEIFLTKWGAFFIPPVPEKYRASVSQCVISASLFILLGEMRTL